VAGPTTAGIILASRLPANWASGPIYAEKADNKTFAFKRGAAISPGDKVLVVDDIFTTGGSVKEVIASVKERHGSVVGIGCWLTAVKKSTIFGAPLYACHRAEAVSYTADKCPLCAAKIPLVKPGGS